MDSIRKTLYLLALFTLFITVDSKILYCENAGPVKVTWDERNRLMFDEEGFLGALAGKPEPPDTGFIEKYMFPQKT